MYGRRAREPRALPCDKDDFSLLHSAPPPSPSFPASCPLPPPVVVSRKRVDAFDRLMAPSASTSSLSCPSSSLSSSSLSPSSVLRSAAPARPPRRYRPRRSVTVPSPSSSSSSPFIAGRGGGGVGGGQLSLDFGQALLGLTVCPDCRCVYNRGQADDERSHATQHDTHVNGLLFSGWADEQLIQPPPSSPSLPPHHRVLCIRVKDLSPSRPSRQEKVCQLLDLLSQYLGDAAAPQLPSPPSSPLSPNLQLFVYLNRCRVVGLLLARPSVPCSALRPINKGRGDEERREEKVKEEQGGVKRMRGDDDVVTRIDGGMKGGSCPPSTTWLLSLDENDRTVAPVGVEKIWVLPSFRRRGIASLLLDCCRCSLLYGQRVDRRDVAFSQPTVDGRRFAQTYTGGNAHIRAYAQ